MKTAVLKISSAALLGFIFLLLVAQNTPNIDFSRIRNGPSISVLTFGAVCNGTHNDGAAITAALVSASSQHASLLFPPGTCVITAAVPVLSNTAIVGAFGSIIKNTTAHGGIFTLSAVSHTSIEGLTLIASNGSPSPPSSTTTGNTISISGGSSYRSVRNNDISGFEWGGVSVGLSGESVSNHHLDISRNYFHDGANMSAVVQGALSNSIMFWGTVKDSLVADNNDISFGDIGIGCQPFASATSTCERNIFRHNHIQNKYTYAMFGYGDIASLSQTVINNIWDGNVINHISSRVAFGFAASNSGECMYLVNGDDNEIINTQCTDAMIGRTGTTLPLGAISVSNGTRNKVTGSTITGSGWGGIHIVNNNAVGNIGTLVAHNTVKNAQRFGYWSDSSNRTQFVDNAAENVGLGGVDGGCFLISTTSLYNDLDHNRCYGGMDPGINILAANASVTYNRTENNLSDGIRVTGNNAVILGNTIRNNTGNGLNVSLTNGFVTIDNNEASDDRGGGALQLFGFTFGDGTAGCDTALPQTCLYKVSGNRGTGNATALWNTALTIFDAHGNFGLNDHMKDGVVANVGGAAISTGTCVVQVVASVGQGGTQAGRFGWSIPIAGFNTSNWKNFTWFPVTIGNNMELSFCNNTGGTLTPSTIPVNFSWWN